MACVSSVAALMTLAVLPMLSAPVVQAAPPPVGWTAADYPRTPTIWRGIEVAEFPSEILAKGVQSALIEAGWQPVGIEYRADKGTHAVVLGEVTTLGDAHFVLRQLRAQKVADGTIVTVQAKNRDPIPFDGPLTAPFSYRPELSEQERQQLLEQHLQVVRDEVWRLEPDDQELVRQFLELVDAGNFRNPTVAEGAITVADAFWEMRRDAETTLFLASRVARGEWPAPTGKPEIEWRARELTFEHLYGTRRDWRGAWQAAREMGRLAGEDTIQVSWSLLRRAALLVDLIGEGAEPAPTLGDVRTLLRQAQEAAPADHSALLSKIELVYLQTFAWEGDWARVENLARMLILRHQDRPAEVAQARLLLAKSLERKEAWQEGIDLLSQVVQATIPNDDLFRFGNEIYSPAEEASRLWERYAGFYTEARAEARRKPRETPAPEPAEETEKEPPAETPVATPASAETEYQ